MIEILASPYPTRNITGVSLCLSINKFVKCQEFITPVVSGRLGEFRKPASNTALASCARYMRDTKAVTAAATDEDALLLGVEFQKEILHFKDMYFIVI